MKRDAVLGVIVGVSAYLSFNADFSFWGLVIAAALYLFVTVGMGKFLKGLSRHYPEPPKRSDDDGPGYTSVH